ncbi:hypothetical protein DFH07DRAFT_973103 [Mycena maculata]|uniref:Berberine/berberine-like domain-containing protein n=1 Tax=Mycena maculata TaxID=230809 RepID=A0AAD7HEV9_9AGAR|nr:hypothetical protein DFH07DRAFT_973103 [Mycena maculata]
MAPGTGRVRWFTLTLEADAALLYDIHRKDVDIFEPDSPISKNGGDPSDISPEDGDLVIALGSALWSDAADDEIMKEKVHEHWRWAERTARERHFLHPFIYMNYASNLQDVRGGIGAENLGQMRRIKDLYDPDDRFGSTWKGGFRL